MRYTCDGQEYLTVPDDHFLRGSGLPNVTFETGGLLVSFSLTRLVLLLRNRTGKTKLMIIEAFEDGRPGVRDMGRWRNVARNHYKAQFSRHCRQQRFY